MPTNPKPRKYRPTLLEQEAMRWAEQAHAHGEHSLQVHWTKSRDYGLCPSVYGSGQRKLAYASGCGYCKLSAAVADTVRFLLPEGSEGRREVWHTHGAGIEAVQRALRAQGWELVHEYNGAKEDHFTVRRIDAGAQEGTKP